MHIYHALINALSAYIIHINLNTILYTHVEDSPTKTIYIKHYTYARTHARTHIRTHARTHAHTHTHTHTQACTHPHTTLAQSPTSIPTLHTQ